MLWAGRRAEKAVGRDRRKRWEEWRRQIAEAVGGLDNATPQGERADRAPHEKETMTTLTATQDTLIPEDTYTVQLVSFSDEKVGDFGPFTIMTVRVVGGDYDGEEIGTGASLKLSPRAKLRGFVEALLGRGLEQREDIDLETLARKGLKARALVETKITETGSEVSKVSKLMKLPPKPGAKAVEAAAPAADEEVPF